MYKCVEIITRIVIERGDNFFHTDQNTSSGRIYGLYIRYNSNYKMFAGLRYLP